MAFPVSSRIAAEGPSRRAGRGQAIHFPKKILTERSDRIYKFILTNWSGSSVIGLQRGRPGRVTAQATSRTAKFQITR
jgi:hypothetical protein